MTTEQLTRGPASSSGRGGLGRGRERAPTEEVSSEDSGIGPMLRRLESTAKPRKAREYLMLLHSYYVQEESRRGSQQGSEVRENLREALKKLAGFVLTLRSLVGEHVSSYPDQLREARASLERISPNEWEGMTNVASVTLASSIAAALGANAVPQQTS